MASQSQSGDSKEGVAFLQRRVAEFGLMAALLGGIFWIFRIILNLVIIGPSREGSYEDLTAPSFALHGLGILFMLLLWLSCRGRARSRRYVERAEVVCFLGSVISYEAMGATIDLEAHPELIIVLALTLVMLARAIYVPGTARRSLVLGVVAGVPLVVSVFLAYSAGPSEGGQSPVERGVVAAAVAGTWWSMTVTLATATSRVIYGLRRVAREARQLGQYTLEEKIGEGGMGAVYRASHAMLRRPTAVKLLLPDHTGERQLARFEREVQLTARLTHPNTITIFDYGRTPDGTFYYAMELLDGATLETIVELDGPQPAERVAHVLEQVAGALTEAHGVGLIHRDIKPANIILCHQGGLPDVAKVLDFGLVKDVGEEAKSESPFATGEHTITGTPLYLSPEATFVEVCSHHLHATPVPPAERLGAPVPEPLSALILRCLEKNPEARPASAEKLLDELHAFGLARTWKPERARDWWNARENNLHARKVKRATSASERTIAVDFAGRLDRLDKYLSEVTG